MAWAPFALMGASMLYDQFNKRDSMNKVPTMTKEQQSLMRRMNQMLGGQGQLGQGYKGALGLQQQLMDPSSEAVNQFSQPYIDQYNQTTIPNLAERFAGFGAQGGGLSSSGFGQALGAAGSGLQSQLAALKAGLGQNAAQSLMQQYGNMSGQVLGAQPFGYQQQAPSMTGGMLQGWAQSGFQGFPSFKGIGYQNKFPLTSGYDQMFRQGGVY